MSCAVTTAAAHGVRAKPGRAPGNTAARGGPYPEQGIQPWFVQLANKCHVSSPSGKDRPFKEILVLASFRRL